MTKRRNFIAGLGVLATGSAAAVGSGAFTSVEADRDVTVEVVNDSSGYLSLIPDPEGTHGNQYVKENSSGGFTLTIDSLNAEGRVVIKDLFEVANSGTQEVEVTLDSRDSPNTDGGQDRVTFTPDLESGVTIGKGNSEVVDVTLDTADGNYFSRTFTITITAEATQ